MALKGAIAKQEIANKILEMFGEIAFTYDKDIRINWVENGEPVQIKIALTAAKVAVEKDGDSAIPGSIKPTAPMIPKSEMIDFDAPAAPAPAPVEPTVEEKENIKLLMQRLGL